MEISLQYNGHNLQRRKMYQNNPRHNLNSIVDMTWLQSIDQTQRDKKNPHLSRVKLEKDQYHKQKQNLYNQLVRKQIEDNLKLDKSTFRVIPQQYKNLFIKTNDNNIHNQDNPQIKIAIADSLNNQTQLFNISKTISYDQDKIHNNNKSNYHNINKQPFSSINYNSKNSYPNNQIYNKISNLNQQYNQLNNYYNPSFNQINKINYDPQYKNQCSSVRNIQGNHHPNLISYPQSSNKHSQQGKSSKNVSKSLFGYHIQNNIQKNQITNLNKDLYKPKIYINDALEPYLRNQVKNYKKHQSFSINYPVKLNY